MTMLQQIHRGRRHSPPRLLIYGTEGIGKSTTAAAAPNPIFIPTEDGLDQIDCASFPLATKLSDVEAALRSLIQEDHDFETVVIDSADWLERLVWDELCVQYGVASIEKVDGGYAKGYTHALTHWRRLIGDLDTLRNGRGMCVILLAHAKVEKFEDPEFSTYDRYSPRLHRHVTSLLTEWADGVLFATRKIITKADPAGGGFGRERVIAAGLGKDASGGGGERILRTVGSPACVAKNRYGLPAELPLSWPALMQALIQAQDLAEAPPLRLTDATSDNPTSNDPQES
ncbi:MAG: ATP-binding protein [Phycisphaeraceae bacterium]|nr:ATP-binding protein [Phycisphaeraceae bacterium]